MRIVEAVASFSAADPTIFDAGESSFVERSGPLG
jgi:hypothetical protein